MTTDFNKETTSPLCPYTLIELAEGISNVLQHILAKEKGLPVSGYVDTIVKANRGGGSIFGFSNRNPAIPRG